MTAAPLRAVPDSATENPYDDDVRRYLELQQKAEEISAEQTAIKARLRPLGSGETSFGVTVTVRGPSRSFNLAKAVEFLAPEQREVCRLDGYDPAKVKRQLPPALLDLAMEPGNGHDVVTIK